MIMPDDNPTLLGTIQDVHGTTLTAELTSAPVSGLLFVDGIAYRIGQVGSFVRIPIGLTSLFGIVAQTGAGAVPERFADGAPFGRRWMRIELIGENVHAGRFERGVSQYPTINDEVHLASSDDIMTIYGSATSEGGIEIGSIANSRSVVAMLDSNRLVTRHSAILGATGSGKSTAVSTIISKLSSASKFPCPRIIVFDLHGEYLSTFGARAHVFRVGTRQSTNENQLFVPYWALPSEKLLALTPLATANDAARKAILDRVAALKKQSLLATAREGVKADSVTADSPVPFSIHRLWYELWCEEFSTHTVAPSANQTTETQAFAIDNDGEFLRGSIQSIEAPSYLATTSGGSDRIYKSGSALGIERQLVAMASQLRDKRYDFLFRPGPWDPKAEIGNPTAQPHEDGDALLGSWLGVEAPVTVLDLSEVPSDVQSDLIGALLSLLFDVLFAAHELPEGGRQRPALVVLEEAHSYLNASDHGQAAVAVRRLVKEGRKYGLGVMLVTQRPSEIDAAILSQCGTMLAMRQNNATDRAHVMAALEDNLEGFFGMLSSLRVGEAIVVGEAASLPMRIAIDAPPPEARPASKDPLVYDPDQESGWNVSRASEDYAGVMSAWRRYRSRAIGGS